jgi:hypothetical protein
VQNFGDETVEHGREAFERRFGINLEEVIERLNNEYGRENENTESIGCNDCA